MQPLLKQFKHHLLNQSPSLSKTAGSNPNTAQTPPTQKASALNNKQTSPTNAKQTSPSSAKQTAASKSKQQTTSKSKQQSTTSSQTVLPEKEPAIKPLSPSTVKNYLSDINRFLFWLSQSIQQPIIKPDHITPTVIKTYHQYLTDTANQSAKHSLNTVNRRLASLRRFGSFLETSGLTDTNPAKHLINPDLTVINPTVKQLLHQYQVWLQSAKLSPSTVKNYLSDVNQYFVWAEKYYEITDGK